MLDLLVSSYEKSKFHGKIFVFACGAMVLLLSLCCGVLKSHLNKLNINRHKALVELQQRVASLHQYQAKLTQQAKYPNHNYQQQRSCQPEVLLHNLSESLPSNSYLTSLLWSETGFVLEGVLLSASTDELSCFATLFAKQNGLFLKGRRITLKDLTEHHFAITYSFFKSG